MCKAAYLFFCFFLLINTLGFSQTRKELETQRKNLQAQIKQVNKLLFDTQKKEKNVLEELKDINKKIEVREELIKTINLEAALLQRKVKKNQQKLDKLNKELEELKEDYAAMILKSYKSKSQQSRMMFVFSSENFYQAYKRIKYMSQYTNFRKKQGLEIGVQTKIIANLNDSLLIQKKEKDTLVLAQKEQKEIIEKDKKIQEGLASEIKKKERKYAKELKDKQKGEQILAQKIDKLIRDEIAKANAKTGTKKSAEFILSPEAKALAAKFEQNQGKLPWPVKSGIITRTFGNQPHPTLSGITINSTGLHFVTEKGSIAEAVFNGEVINVLVTSEGHRNVLVRHGNYISAYNNLGKVFVKKGQNVTTGEALGEVFTDKVTGKTILIFVLFKNTTRLNPSSWILKR